MITIRRLKTGEAGLYREVRLTALRDSPEAFATRYKDALARSEESWRAQAETSATGRDRATFVVLVEGTGPVGLAALYRDEHAPETGELLQMWVAPEMRGGPAATGLIAEVFRWAAAQGFSRVRAEVMSGNARALRFYEKHGFTRSAGETGVSEPGVVLTKAVEDAAPDLVAGSPVPGPNGQHLDEESIGSIRRAILADGPRIAEIQVEGWRAAYRGMMPDDYLDGLNAERRRGIWEGFVREGTGELFVASDGPGVAGFCHLIPSRDADTAGVLEIAAIYVDPRQWRKGHGRKLCAAALGSAMLQGSHALTLWVLEGNTGGRRFYEAMGLAADGARKSDQVRGFVIHEIRYRIELGG